MDDRVSEMTSTMKKNSPATEEQIKDAEAGLGMSLPTQYKEFMLDTNGATGGLGEGAYADTWPIDVIVRYNIEYEVEKFTPGLIYFGSDGGGMAYAFDKRDETMPIVEIPFESIHITDAVRLSDTFAGFLEHLHAYRYPAI
jgi:hypothetical protein